MEWIDRQLHDNPAQLSQAVRVGDGNKKHTDAIFAGDAKVEFSNSPEWDYFVQLRPDGKLTITTRPDGYKAVITGAEPTEGGMTITIDMRKT